MAKTHAGDCIDIDPFIPTGQCTICTGTPQDTLVPEERPGGELAALTPEETAVPIPEAPAEEPAPEEAPADPAPEEVPA